MYRKVEFVRENPLRIGDVIFPAITTEEGSSECSVAPLVVWKTEYKGRKCIYTTATPAEFEKVFPYNVRGEAIGPIKWIGWTNPDSAYGRGLKVYIPNVFNGEYQPTLKEDEAVEIVEIQPRSALGEIVRFELDKTGRNLILCYEELLKTARKLEGLC